MLAGSIRRWVGGTTDDQRCAEWTSPLRSSSTVVYKLHYCAGEGPAYRQDPFGDGPAVLWTRYPEELLGHLLWVLEVLPASNNQGRIDIFVFNRNALVEVEVLNPVAIKPCIRC